MEVFFDKQLLIEISEIFKKALFFDMELSNGLLQLILLRLES